MTMTEYSSRHMWVLSSNHGARSYNRSHNGQQRSLKLMYVGITNAKPDLSEHVALLIRVSETVLAAVATCDQPPVCKSIRLSQDSCRSVGICVPKHTTWRPSHSMNGSAHTRLKPMPTGLKRH